MYALIFFNTNSRDPVHKQVIFSFISIHFYLFLFYYYMYFYRADIHSHLSLVGRLINILTYSLFLKTNIFVLIFLTQVHAPMVVPKVIPEFKNFLLELQLIVFMTQTL